MEKPKSYNRMNMVIEHFIFEVKHRCNLLIQPSTHFKKSFIYLLVLSPVDYINRSACIVSC